MARPPLIVRKPLEAVLDRHGFGEGHLTAEVINEGDSHVTIAIQRGGSRAVLRRPPGPPIPARARDVLREAHLLMLLAPTQARTPRVLLACDDPSVIGVPFYVMEEVAGTVIGSLLPTRFDTVTGRAAVASELVDALVELHAIDLEGSGLDQIGRSFAFLERHVERWAGIWQRHRTREVPVLDEVTTWLRSNRPEAATAATVVHGDYRLGNVVFAEDGPPRLRAVLDWELASVGDPLCDVAWMLTMWPDREDEAGTLLAMAGTVAQDGLPSRAEVAALYAERSGRSVANLGWYTVLALWRAAIGLETVLEQVLAGASDDSFAHELEIGVPELAARARAAGLSAM